MSISLIWGSSFVLIAEGLESFGPGLITWFRIGSGAAILFVFPSAKQPVARADWPRLVLLSLVWVAIPFTLFPIAQQYINSATAGMLNGAMPVFAAIIFTLLVRHLPSRVHLVGIGIGLLGVIGISWPNLGETTNQTLGILLAIVATSGYALAVNITSPLSQKYDSIPIMARMLVLATIWTLPYGVIDLFNSTWSASSMISVLILGMVGTGAAFGIMAKLVGRVGSTRAAFITYLMPVVALVLGTLLRDELVEWIAVVGVGLVLVGAFLASRGANRQRPPLPELPSDS